MCPPAKRVSKWLSIDVTCARCCLAEKTRRWLGRYSWRNPPQVQGQGALILPGWTQPRPNWQTEVLPTLCLAGQFGITNGAYLGLQADWAHAHFTYTNRLWRVTDLVVSRPERACGWNMKLMKQRRLLLERFTARWIPGGETALSAHQQPDIWFTSPSPPRRPSRAKSGTCPYP
jgi:hypothetical protein